jgi:AcrR family transcriptional regulator
MGAEATDETRGEKTRRQLIEAAGWLFAEKGFAATSIRDICTRADVNIAAAHYHFGDKQKLYQATLEHCVEEHRKTFPLPAREDKGDPGEFLAEYICAILSRMTRTHQSEWRTALLNREMFTPSKEFVKFISENCVGPDIVEFTATFRRIAPKASDEAIKTAVMGVIGMICAYAMPVPLLKATVPSQQLSLKQCKTIAQFISHANIAGLLSLTGRKGP